MEEVSHHAVGSAEESESVHYDSVIEMIHSHRDVFVLVGLAGAGKSTAADMIQQHHDENVQTFEVSDFVRTKFEEAHDDAVNDNELGEWAAEQKAEHGDDYFVRQMAETIRDSNTPHVVISGVRSPAEAKAVEDVFSMGNVMTLAIWTLPDLRFNRKYGADMMDDAETLQTFADRNDREKHEWGAKEFFARGGEHTADGIIPNHDDCDALEEHLTNFLDGKGQYDKSPFPHNDPDVVAQYL